MPFDRSQNEVPGKAGLVHLARVLRDREAWPSGHVWDYNRYCACAMGLAARIWPIEGTVRGMSEAFGISIESAARVFMGCGPAARVEPEHVADAIEQLLAPRPTVRRRVSQLLGISTQS